MQVNQHTRQIVDHLTLIHSRSVDRFCWFCPSAKIPHGFGKGGIKSWWNGTPSCRNTLPIVQKAYAGRAASNVEVCKAPSPMIPRQLTEGTTAMAERTRAIRLRLHACPGMLPRPVRHQMPFVGQSLFHSLSTIDTDKTLCCASHPAIDDHLPRVDD